MMRVNRSTLMVASLLSILTCLSCSFAQEWTRFRGPNGSGISSAKTVPVRWTENDYNWKVKLPGLGHSSPVVWGAKIFLTCGDEATGKRMIVCLRSSDGKELWRHAIDGPQHRKHKLNSFASSTPALDENHVYVCFGMPEHPTELLIRHVIRQAIRRGPPHTWLR